MVIRDHFKELNCSEQEVSWAENGALSGRIGAEMEQTFASAQPAIVYRAGMPDRHSHSLQAAVRRARWLAELAGALAQADRLAQRIDAQDPRHGGDLLRAQLTALRGEVDLLQRGLGHDPTD